MTDRPLRIVHTEASKGWGGQEIRILTEARAVLARGHDVRLLANADSEILKAAPAFGVPAEAADLARKAPAAVLALRRRIKALAPDVINPHSSVDSWLVALARIGLKPRPRVVRTRHLSAPVPRNPASRWVYNAGCDFIMTTGEAIVEALTADGFVRKDRIASVPTGIDTDRYSPGDRLAARARLGLPVDARLFGIVATLRSWKGHVDLIDAFAGLADPTAHLVIVGDGPQERKIRARIAERALETRVTLAGRQADVVPYLQALDVFVLPSYANEGVPQAVLQALSVGLPIVSCPIGGIPECAGGLPGVTLVPPRDVTALAQALGHVDDSPEGASIRRARVVDRYSEARMADTVLSVFRADRS